MGTEPRRDFPGVPFDSKAPEAVPSPEAASPFALRIAQVRPQLLWAPLLPWGPLHQWLCLRNPSGLTPPSPHPLPPPHTGAQAGTPAGATEGGEL